MKIIAKTGIIWVRMALKKIGSVSMTVGPVANACRVASHEMMLEFAFLRANVLLDPAMVAMAIIITCRFLRV
jgi:hypothetical protein